MTTVQQKFAHFFAIPMTGLGLFSGYRGDAWLKNRLEIFNEFVFPSLLAQKDFILWFCWRPEEKTNPIVQEFQKSLEGVRNLSVVHTFGGIILYDDKYDDKTAKARLLSALEISLPGLKDVVGEADYVITTLQPSDDLYLSHVAGMIKEEALKSEEFYDTIKIFGFTKGYIMNYATKEIAEYLGTNDRPPEVIKNYPDTTPPFYSILFKREDFLDPQKHFNLIKDIKSHEDIANHPHFIPIEGRGFVVGCHGNNISTTFNHPFKGRTLTTQEAESIMIKTGTLYSKPIISKPSTRLKVRRLLNKLPFRKVFRDFYYSLPARYRKL